MANVNAKHDNNSSIYSGDLVARVKAGDPDALRDLFLSFFSRLCRYGFRIVQSKEDVEDMVEGVFEQMWQNRNALDPSRSITAYLFQSVQNRAIDFLRLERNAHTSFEERDPNYPSSSNPIQEMLDNELTEAVAKAIDRLPKKCKAVYTLSRQEGLSYLEIADVLGISEKTVENQMSRAFRILRWRLKAFRD